MGHVLKSRIKNVCFNFLDTSVIAWRLNRIESTGTGSDRSFHSMFTCVLKFLQYFKESKENKTKSEREEYDETQGSGNTEEKIFVILDIFLKQSKKERKPMATNY